MKKYRLLVKYTWASALVVFLLLFFLKYSTYSKFLISRAWYDWVTSYSHSEVVEVNVIESYAIDNLINTDFSQTKDKLPSGYLG